MNLAFNVSLKYFLSPETSGKTNKAEWDRFDREIKTKGKFPTSLSPQLRRSKTDLFALWLDSGYDWDAVECKVTRSNESKQLNRREMQAVQAKELYAKMSQERFTQLIAKRMAQGLYYEDEDHPQDEMDRSVMFRFGFRPIRFDM